ncbi:MAG: hypothetical protein DRI90_20180, partial [Deltaproteobacteria bacterium]
ETLPVAANGGTGYGLVITSDRSPAAARPSATVRSSLMVQNHSVGLGVVAVDAIVEAVAVRDTACEVASGAFGRGIVAEINPETGSRAMLQLAGSVVEGSHEVGVIVLGSEATISGTVIRDTLPRSIDGLFGRGLIVQLAAETSTRSDVTVSQVLIEGSHEAGLYIAGADGTVEDTVVATTGAQNDTDLFGDGVIASTLFTPGGVASTNLSLQRCLIRDSARAGIASFGATIALANSALDCNPISLAGEPFLDQPFAISDSGGNACGCASETVLCQVLSTGLTPPDPL